MKRFLFLTTVLLCLCTTQMHAYDFVVNNIYYNIKSTTEVEVTYKDTNYNSYSGDITIPATVTDSGTTYSVTSIGSSAFQGCSSLTSVTIGNSVTSIGEKAFYGCSGLTSVTIPESVRGIKNYAFDGCYGLTAVYISDIAAWCQIAFVSSDSNPLAYAGHLYLAGVELKNLTIPNSVTAIRKYAFLQFDNLTSVTIPNSVRSIENYAFHGCDGLTSVTIGNGVTSIGEEAFSFCSGLTSITIGNGVSSIGNRAFYGCYGLTAVHISDIAAWCQIGFVSSNSNPLAYAGHLYLAGVELKNLTIPNSVTAISKYAFSDCTGLTSVYIHNSVGNIGDWAFKGCSGLTSITMVGSTEGRLDIGKFAFTGCSGLTSITFPRKVYLIDRCAFSQCTGLTSVTMEKETPPYLGTYGDAFTNIGPNCVLYVPTPKAAQLYTSSDWGQFFGGGIKSLTTWPTTTTFPQTSYSVTYGSSFTAPTATVKYGSTTVTSPAVTYASSNTAVATVNSSTGAVTLKGGGTTTITATYAGDEAAGYSSSQGSYELTVNKASTTTSFPQSSYSATYDGVAFTAPTATVKSGTTTITNPAVTYASSNTSVATVNSSTGAVTIKAAGTTTITATYAGNTNYEGSTATYTLVVSNKPVPVVSFPQTSYTATYGSAFTAPTATVKSGSTTITSPAVTYASSNTAVATVNSTTGAVTIKAAGTTTITATYAGNTTYASSTGSYTLTVNPAGGVTTTFPKTSYTATYGSTFTAPKATVKYISTTLTSPAVTYASSNTAVATVDTSTGAVTLKGIGSATITATYPGNNMYASSSGSYTLNVLPALSFATTFRVIAMGSSKTLQLNPVIKPSSLTKDQLTWTSSNTTVATVNSSGLVTGKKDGEVTITCSYTVNGQKASADCTVRVSDLPKVTGVTLETSVVAVKAGKTVQLTPTVSPTSVTVSQLGWTSADASIATVSGGTVSGVKNGVTTVTCQGITSKGDILSATCKVIVSPYPLVKSLSFANPHRVIAMGTSTTLQLNPVISPSSVTKDKLSWSSSNTAVATVSSSGLVTGKTEGEADITCKGVDETGKTVSATCKITVSRLPKVTSLSFGNPHRVIAMGSGTTTLQLNPAISPSTVGREKLGWSSSDESIATVDDKGLVTALKEGETNVTCQGITSSGAIVSATCKITVSHLAKITGVTLPKDWYLLAMGTSPTLQLTPTISPTTVKANQLEWTSSDTNVATVDKNGLVTGKKDGTVTVTCQGIASSGAIVSASCQVQVSTTAMVKSLSFANPHRVIAMGTSTTLQLNPVISPSSVTKDKLKWSCSNTAVATVNGSGLVTGKTEGEADITCKGVDETGKTVSATCKITVSHLPKVTGLSFAESKYVLAMGTSKTLTLAPTIAPTSVKASQLGWTSSDESIATVSGGVVTGKKRGTTTITCQGITSSGAIVSATCQVQVSPYTLVESLSFSNTHRVLAMGTSTTLQLNPKISPSSVTKDKLSWFTSNASVATVDSKGLVTGLKEGEVKITCKGVNAEGTTISAVCNITVSRLAKVTSLSFTQSTYTIGMLSSKTLQLEPTIAPTTVTASQLEWESSDTIATVSKGLVTGLKEGEVTITCRGINSSGTIVQASCKVIVHNLKKADVTSIKFPSPVEVMEGKGTLKLAPIVVPDTLDLSELSWSSSDSLIATVSGNKDGGQVIGKNYGTATITCAALNMQGELISASCRVTVYKEDLIYVGNIFYGISTDSISTDNSYAYVTNCAGGKPSDENERSEYSGTLNIPEAVTYDGVTYSVQSVGQYAFFNMKELQAVVIPKSVTTFEKHAFEKSKNLARVAFSNKDKGLLSVGDSAFYQCTKLSSITLPNSTKRIGHSAFRYCSSLNKVSLGSSLNYINEYAFADCKKLDNVTLPESLKSIQISAFLNDIALSSITYPEGLQGIGASAFANCTGLKTVTFNTSNYTLTVGEDAYLGSNAISRVMVKNLDAWVNINFSNPAANPASIAKHLYDADGVEIIHAVVPEGPIYVNNNVFYNCASIESIELPSSIQFVNDNIIYGCTSLRKMISRAEDVPMFIGVLEPSAMSSVFKATTLYVPANSLNDYKYDDWWKRFGKIEKITSGMSKFRGDDATSIEELDVQGEDDTIYDLNGRKVDVRPLPKGIYIRNGKKFYVK